MIWPVVSFFLVIFIEVFRNWCIIDAGNRRPTYWWSQVIRIFISFAYWVVIKLTCDITYYQWWAFIPFLLFSFWWTFDYGLIQFRNGMGRMLGEDPGLTWYRLNPKGSFIDRLQCKTLSLPAWFMIKLLFMIASIYLLFTI